MCHKRAQHWRKWFPFLFNHTNVKHLDSILQWREMGWEKGVWQPDRWCQSPGTSWGKRAYAHIWTGTTRSTGTNKHSRTCSSQAGFITPPSVSADKDPQTPESACVCVLFPCRRRFWASLNPSVTELYRFVRQQQSEQDLHKVNECHSCLPNVWETAQLIARDDHKHTYQWLKHCDHTVRSRIQSPEGYL